VATLRGLQADCCLDLDNNRFDNREDALRRLSEQLQHHNAASLKSVTPSVQTA